MCEMGILYGWKYMAQKLIELYGKALSDGHSATEAGNIVMNKILEIDRKKNYAHYFDIRTNHLNEKDWRRSFSINQFLYGIILAATADGQLHNSFDEIIPILQEQFKNENQ